MLRQWKRCGWLGTSLIITVLVLAGCLAAYNDVVLGNKEHGLSCDQLPPATSVDQTVAAHPDTVEQILVVSAGNVFFDIDRYTCPGKADIIISFSTRSEREKIEMILDEGTFFGVPVRLRNQ